MYKVERSKPPSEIGTAILNALIASQTSLEGRESPFKEHLKFIGVKSQAQLGREARLASVDGRDDDDFITIHAWEADIRGGYVGSENVEDLKCTREPEHLGRSVLTLMDRIPEPRGSKKSNERVVTVKTKWKRGLAWLAVRTDDEQRVADVLADNGVKAAVCSEGKPNPPGSAGVYSPEPGWTLAIGGGVLPDAENDGFVAFLKAISIPLGEVYYFANYRIVEFHAWAKVVNGEIIRAFTWLGESGETHVNEGALTPEELAMGKDSLEFPDDEVVFQLAKAWSVDPAIVIESVG